MGEKGACELANQYTYSEAAALLSAQIGDEVSHGAIHSWVQKSGQALRREEHQRWRAVFEDGEVLEGKGDEKEIVVPRMLHLIDNRARSAILLSGAPGKNNF